MKLGFSDAQLTVIKRGRYCKEQGDYCRLLGSDVAPLVFEILEDGYEMELLAPSADLSFKRLKLIYLMLRNKVWGRKIDWHLGWREPLLMWAHAIAPWLVDPILSTYPHEPNHADEYSMIHGDPTLANVMMRGSHIVLSDPMPRMDYRKEIPYKVEVDMGKLIQSAAGWEHHLGALNAPNRLHQEMICELDSADRRPATLWAAIHLARLADRAMKQQKWETAQWARGLSLELRHDS